MSEDDPEVTEALHRLTRIMNHVLIDEYHASCSRDLLQQNGFFDGWGAGDMAKNALGVDVNADTYTAPDGLPDDKFAMGGVSVGDVKTQIAELISANEREVKTRTDANTTKKNCNAAITANNKKLQEKISWLKQAIEWKKKSDKMTTPETKS